MTRTKSIYLAIVAALMLPMAANAALIEIQIDDEFILGVSGYGQLDFIGDLSADGIFALASTDFNAFSLTLQSPDGGPVTFGLADLTSFSQYRVVGGLLDRIGVSGQVAQGSQGCPDFGSGLATCSFFMTVNFNSGFDVATSANSLGGRDFDYSFVASVPEPGTLALLGLGLVGMAARRGWKTSTA